MTILIQLILMVLAMYCIFLAGYGVFVEALVAKGHKESRKYAVWGIFLIIAIIVLPYITGAPT